MMMWKITRIDKAETYDIVEVKCPNCGMKETLTRYQYEDRKKTCYTCEKTFFLPEKGDRDNESLGI